jgi:Ser/Thr protein kinase RdoA (MazF antagonist)
MALTNQLAAALRSTYNLDTITKTTPVSLGYLSNNHILKTPTQQFFLKQYRYDNRQRIEQAHAAKQFFAAGNIPIILPLAAQDGQTILEHDHRYYSLFPYVDGRVLHAPELTTTALHSAGALLGQIHRLSLNRPLPANPRRGIQAWNQAAGLAKADQIISLIKSQPNHTSFDLLALETLRLKRDLIAAETSQYTDYDLGTDHLIHGDYHELNLFFDANDQATHTFDLEKAGLAPRLLEVIRSIHIMCLGPGFGEPELIRARQFLAAYRQTYPFSDDEFHQALKVYHVRLMHSMWVEEFHYLDRYHRTDIFLAKEHAVLDYLSVHFDELEAALLESPAAA